MNGMLIIPYISLHLLHFFSIGFVCFFFFTFHAPNLDGTRVLRTIFGAQFINTIRLHSANVAFSRSHHSVYLFISVYGKVFTLLYVSQSESNNKSKQYV